MSSLVQNMTAKVNDTSFIKKVVMQPPLFWLIMFTAIMFIAALILAGEQDKEKAAVATGLIGMVSLLIVAYKSSTFGYYGHCSRLIKQMEKTV